MLKRRRALTGLVLGLVLSCLAGVLVSAPAIAQDADHYRGGWRTDAGDRHVYEFVIRGTEVTGIYCTFCADGTTLAPIHGSFDAGDGIAYTVRHLNLDGSLASTDTLTARLVDGALHVSGTRGADGAAIEHVAIKDPRGPTPAPYPQAVLPPDAPPVPVLQGGFGGGGGGSPAPYVAPGEWKELTADDVVGVWLGFGTGMDKQYFLIRKDGDRLFGLACGRCDNPYTFGALENFVIEGDVLTFDIVHQDWGEGTRLPFTRHVSAQIGMNEMHMDARRDDAPDRPGIVASLVGPVAIEATAGNVVVDKE